MNKAMKIFKSMKSCPFCGGKPSYRQGPESIDKWYWTAYCTECHAEITTFEPIDNIEKATEEPTEGYIRMIELWNHRVER